MTEKVKLTKVQVGAIESIRSGINEGLTPGNIRRQLEKRWMDKPYVMLNELTFEQFIVAVLGDYEIEETFKAGDWVKVNWRDKKPTIHKARIVNNAFAIIDGEQANTEPPIRIIEHATPEEIAEEKQRRWWAKHGRDVWELRDNDILYYDGEFREVEEVSEFGVIMLSLERAYLPIETISSRYIVACFAEDRKDVE